MIAAAGLIGLAVVLGMLGGRALRAASWTRRAPVLGIAAWQGLSFSVVASMFLAGLSLALPTAPAALTGGIASYFGACAVAIREHYSTPGGITAGLLGALFALWVCVRIVHCVSREYVTATRARRRQLEAVTLVGRPGLVEGTLVVQFERAAAYCLPGRRPKVVFTSGALDSLSEVECDLVLRHEHAHISARHDLLLVLARGLGAAFPVIPLLADAPVEVGALVEMHADDRAVRNGGRAALASAVMRLACAPCPTGALAANGAAVVERVSRLVLLPSVPSRAFRWLVAVGVALIAAVPLAIALAPGLEAIILDYCPLNRHACDVGQILGAD